MSDHIEHVLVGMRGRRASVRLRLRWDHSPKTCAVVARALPIEERLWHAKYANHEIYVLLPVEETFGEEPPGEWQCMYPAPGDLMWIFHPPGLLPPEVCPPDNPRRVVDMAFFYDRGNNLYGPWGPNPGNIFATATSIDELEAFRDAVLEVWMGGFATERMYIEAA